MRKTFWIIICCAITYLGKSQTTTHYTLYNLTPITVNPGHIGGFQGTARVGGILRGQWLDTQGPKQPSIYVDAPIIRGFREQDWVGIGLTMDVLGGAGQHSGTLSSGQQIGVAYHFALDEDQKSVLAFGLQYGSNSFNADLRNGNNCTPEALDLTLSGGSSGACNAQLFSTVTQQGEYAQSKSGLNLGLTYRSHLNKKSTLKAGISVNEITSNQQIITPGPLDTMQARTTPRQLSTRYALYGEYTQYITENFRISPSLFFQTSSYGTSTQFQFMTGFLVNPEQNMVFNAGLGLRAENTAAQMIFGLEQGDLRGGVSFDIPLSGISGGDGFQNAFELGISYIININKKPDVKPVIFCPRL